MAVAYLHRLLIWALAVRLANTCLCCWPDAAKYFSYDVQHLVGGNKDIVEKLEQLFLESSSGKCVIYGGRFLGTCWIEGVGRVTTPQILGITSQLDQWSF